MTREHGVRFDAASLQVVYIKISGPCSPAAAAAGSGRDALSLYEFPAAGGDRWSPPIHAFGMKHGILIVLIVAAAACGSSRRKCEKLGERLYEYSCKLTITEQVLEASREIIERMPEKCPDDVIVEKDGEERSVGSVVRLFGRICQKSGLPKAAQYLLEYRLDHWESADEEFSLAVERVFVSKPDVTLEFIRKQRDSVRIQLLNDIVWGFLSNRVYGPKDPYENQPRRHFRDITDIPKEILNRHNYRQIFYKLHEDMARISRRYEEEVSYILDEVDTYLNTWGVEY